ncbi:hypothetical protein [Streptomyces sp. H39-S7]|uniref:hypothetical protein n=1 Tax=Streptomyces sp. H39-S7 TaxID=3004357 RepID=UPI0022B02A82|nr:hypothetical protein [Streptomyces sp. H39-S7]MCZ4125769.1 hypothetical protein [Streptomyces sp. H39-S7]
MDLVPYTAWARSRYAVLTADPDAGQTSTEITLLMGVILGLAILTLAILIIFIGI